MTNYSRGRKTEYDAVADLERAGAIEAQRTAGSHGLFDVVAVFGNGYRFITCKRSKTLSALKSDCAAAREEISKLPAMPGVSREVWGWLDGKGWEIREVL